MSTPVSTAPGFDPKGLWDGRKTVPFRALDRPQMVSAEEATAFLDDDEYVLGVTVGGESRAYPTRFAWFHHVINDEIGNGEKNGGVPVAVTYCSVCNSGLCYDARLDGKPIHLDFFGLYNGVVALCDRETESVFPIVTGTFARGPLAGKGLPVYPLLDTTWGAWKKLHPQTRVMAPGEAEKRFYRPRGKENAESRDYQAFPVPFFAPTMTRADKRLPAFAKVLGVTLPATRATGRAESLHRAYPVKEMQEKGPVLLEEWDGVPVAVLYDAQNVTAVAVSRRLDGRVLTLEARPQTDGQTAFFDKETGTRWNIEGLGEAGPLAGKRLELLDAHLSQWYGWVAYFPETTIYNRADAPQPATWAEVMPGPATPKPQP